MVRTRRNVLNSFSGRITFLVLFGTTLTAVAVSVVVLMMSGNAFRQTYQRSQENVFRQIETELNDLNDHLTAITDAIDSSWAFRLFLTGTEEMDNRQTFQNVYQMEKDLEESKPSDMERLNVLVIGMNGRHYLSRTELISVSDEAILESAPVQTAIAQPEQLHYAYSHGAYTATSKNTDVIVVTKALYYQESREVYGIVIFTLTMDDMKKYYDYFASDITSFYLSDSDSLVLCSSDRNAVGRTMPSFQGAKYTILTAGLPFWGCSIYGIIDNDLALANLYNMPLLILICIAIGLGVLILSIAFTRRTVRPLSQLSDKMARARTENFREVMPVEGPSEVREVAITYNAMLQDIQTYLDEIVESKNRQREAEIHALQMQINPHYIYNTLASIKMLIYQNDSRRTTEVIDAFISLLRNTISNADEFITVQQETDNLSNYVLINHTRYGDAVQVHFYVSDVCNDCLLPKMILQPFVENAFFHAFPNGRTGTIEIYMKVHDGNLEIRIADDGVGMSQEVAEQMLRTESHREHFSGIGMHNVQERLQLLYGEDYGVRIRSQEGMGTTVIVTLPVKRQNNAGTEDGDGQQEPEEKNGVSEGAAEKGTANA